MLQSINVAFNYSLVSFILVVVCILGQEFELCLLGLQDNFPNFKRDSQFPYLNHWQGFSKILYRSRNYP